MQKRTVVVTGANTGIGRITAIELAKRGAHVVITARNESKAKPVLDEISRAGGRSEFIPLELSSLESVRKSAGIFLASGLPLHVLINNAGLAGHRGITKDGFEIQFGVNHLGHFLLTQLLEEKLKESAPSRVVIVASKAHYRASKLDFDVERTTKGLSGFPAYSNSKLANVLHAKALAKRLAGSGGHDVRPPPRGDRDRCLATNPAPFSRRGHTQHADPRARRGDIDLLRVRTRNRGRDRALLQPER